MAVVLSGTGATVGDYDMIDRLIARLGDSTSVPYRIAYMVGNRGTYGASEFCRYYSGDAVLYNSARLVNRNPDEAAGVSTIRYDDALTGFQMRRSLPLCRPGSARMPTARNLIDGAPQNDDCSESAPSGPAWTWIHRTPDMTSPVTLARFSFRHDLRASFDFFTVHPPAEKEQPSRDEAIHPFIRRVTPPAFRRGLPYYPPILVGDVNSLAGDIRSIEGFTETHGQNSGDLMTVRRGNLDAFGAFNDYRTLERRLLPDNQASGFFSDHIGLFVRLGWANPGDVKLSRVSDLPDGTVADTEGTGGLWVIAGGAKFGIPSEETHQRLYGSRWHLTLPPPGLGAVGQVPLDGTVLRQENGSLWVIVGGAKFLVPDQATLSRLYPGARAVTLWDAAVASIPTVPENGALISDDDGRIWLIAGGARYQVPGQAVVDRLYPDRRPSPLWNGALANIGQVPVGGTLFREESSQSVFVMRRAGLVPATGLYPVEAVVVVWDGALQAIAP